MRRTIRSIGVLFVAILGAVALAIGSAFSAALAFGAVALIVPGTGTPNANIVDNYLTQARDRYLTTTACGPTGAGCPVGPDLQGINYPATFFPLFIFNNWCTATRCNTWDDSVGQGTAALNSAIDAALHDPNNPTQDVVVFGYSQGGAVVADSLNGYIRGLSAPEKARIQVVTIGGIENPDGGLWQRLAFLQYIPILNISFNPPMTSPGVNYTSYGFEYDPVVNAPRYFGNALAVLNALAAFENVHGYYLAPNGNGPTDTLPFGYTDTTLAKALDCTQSPANCRYGSGNTYVTIPALTLPIYDLLLGITPGPLKTLVQPLVNLLTPVTRLLIDLGYNYSGDPSVPTPLSILPFNPFTFNPIDFSVKFVQAIGQGIQDAINGGPSTLLAPPAPAVNPLTLSARSVSTSSTAAAVEDPTTPVTQDKSAAVAEDVQQVGDGKTVTDQAAADKAAADQAALDKAAADKAAADKAAADKAAADKAASDKAAADQAAADKAAADKAAADKAAADKAAADKAAADKAAADKAKEAKDAADKAKEAKDAADKDAAAQAAADKAKEAAQNAKDAGAAGSGSTSGTETKTDPTGTGSGSPAGESEKQAA
ncbi:PE-PPE domain-containing protein [Mycolicibacterium sp.]|uniref:PE-PPE domain-containing protein n=1 Tax=Mycolicibacterium sp. TaxID=2320850 RepID=UPI001A30E6B9|nr:PE-PPE domain-containing protein [Mycolicibacterium sp.]MBJ7336731.1 PE-PPE domain-containing protein [Mycolicibacterium sp.]